MPTIDVQDHIHLDLPTNISGSPENAPIRTWTVTDRQPVPEVYADLDRSWVGEELFNSMANAQGNPAVFWNMRYTVRVPKADFSALRALLLQTVSLIDNEHCQDGQDHTSYIQNMRMMEFKYAGPYDKLLERQDVEIYLSARTAT